MLFKKSQSIKFLQPTMESFETIVGPATEVHGRLVANESMRIDGRIIGNIEARQGKDVSIKTTSTIHIRMRIDTRSCIVDHRHLHNSQSGYSDDSTQCLAGCNHGVFHWRCSYNISGLCGQKPEVR